MTNHVKKPPAPLPLVLHRGTLRPASEVFMARTAVFLLALATLATGCQNNCQQICVRMADYATECGFTVPDAELDTCIDDFAKIETKEDRQTCSEYGDATTLRNQWTCDELEIYWAIAAE